MYSYSVTDLFEYNSLQNTDAQITHCFILMRKLRINSKLHYASISISFTLFLKNFDFDFVYTLKSCTLSTIKDIYSQNRLKS